MADTATGSECDIINHGELPSAWISGISVSQTVKGCEGPRVWGVGGLGAQEGVGGSLNTIGIRAQSVTKKRGK